MPSNIRPKYDPLKSCFDQFDNPPVNPCPPEGGLTQQQLEKIETDLQDAITTISNAAVIVPQNRETRRRRTLVVDNIEQFDTSAEFIVEHPDIVSAAVDAERWLTATHRVREGLEIKTLSDKLNNAVNTMILAEANIAFEEFTDAYTCMQILAGKGVPDATVIWPTMREVYEHLRGKRGPMCPVAEVVKISHEANKVISKNKPMLLEALKSPSELARLTTEIAKEVDKIEDQTLKNIHHTSENS